MFCFYGSWATYQTGGGKFDIEDIDAKKCTHLTYSFVGLKSDGTVKVLDDWNDIQLSEQKRFFKFCATFSKNNNNNLLQRDSQDLSI